MSRFVAASFAIVSASSFPRIATCALTQQKWIFQSVCPNSVAFRLIFSMSRVRKVLFWSESRVVWLSVYMVTDLSVVCLYVCMYVRTYVRTYVCMCVYICMYMCMYVFMYVCIFYFAWSITCSNTTCILSYLQLLYKFINTYNYCYILRWFGFAVAIKFVKRKCVYKSNKRMIVFSH
jgi:hypothetical protein